MRSLPYVVLIALAACGSKDKDSGKDKSAESKEAKAVDKKPDPPKKAEPQPAAGLFVGSTPRPFPPLDKIKIGMPAADAAKLVPGGKLDAIARIETLKDVEVMVDSTEDKKSVRVIQFFAKSMPLADVRAKLEQLWGKGVEDPGHKGHWVWSDPSGGWRAELQGYAGEQGGEIDFVDLQPFDTFLTGAGKLDVEATAPLLGMAEADVLKLPGAKKVDDKRIDLQHPVNEETTSGPDVIVTLDGGKVTQWQVQLFTPLDPDGQKKVTDRLEARFGKAKPRDEMYWDYTGKTEKAILDVSHMKEPAEWGLSLTVQPL